jgi:hypothetical protein
MARHRSALAERANLLAQRAIFLRPEMRALSHCMKMLRTPALFNQRGLEGTSLTHLMETTALERVLPPQSNSFWSLLPGARLSVLKRTPHLPRKWQSEKRCETLAR